MLGVMHSTLNKWLEELEEETSIVTSNEIDEEANGNMVTFGFNHDSLKDWDKGSVLDFIAGCAEIYRTKSDGIAMVFYSWFDEQAGQIRMSSVSQAHKKLPFGCKLNSTDLSQVVNGLFTEDSGLYTKGTLDVWCQNI
jgi:hypothetical protein